jgi:hypothetical protein
MRSGVPGFDSSSARLLAVGVSSVTCLQFYCADVLLDVVKREVRPKSINERIGSVERGVFPSVRCILELASWFACTFAVLSDDSKVDAREDSEQGRTRGRRANPKLSLA